MIEEIGATGQDRLNGVSSGKKPRAERSERAGSKDRSAGEAPEVSVSSRLADYVECIKRADNVRKERVHQVLEKMQRGELITPETVQRAAQKILQEGP